MGLGPSKEKIKKILENSSNDEPLKMINHLPYKNERFFSTSLSNAHKYSISNNYDDCSLELNSVESSMAESIPITHKLSKVNSNKYPYCTVGILFCKFSNGEEENYTCFIIGDNVIVTLASNIFKNKSMAIEIKSSFSDEIIQKNNIVLFPDFDINNIKEEENLVCLIYNNSLNLDFLGVRQLMKEEWEDKEMFLICSVGLVDFSNKTEINTGITDQDYELESVKRFNNYFLKNNDEDMQTRATTQCSTNHNINNNININSNVNINSNDDINEKKLFKNISEIHEINSSLNSKLSTDINDIKKLKNCKGGPVYYKGFDNGPYVTGFLDNSYQLQPLTTKSLHFLINSVNKGKKSRKKIKHNLVEKNVIKLNLANLELYPLDVKYIIEFDLINLSYLDLSSNSIKSQGVFYLSQGNYPHLKYLNLNFGEIGDEGLSNLANSHFNSLEQLYLFHNNISSVGIEALCKADFLHNLIILTLSENPNIKDNGIKFIIEYKSWTRLAIINLNDTGLTDESIYLLSNATMHNLKKINLKENLFTPKVYDVISSWKLNNIKIEYDNPNKQKNNKKIRTIY